MFGMTPHLWAMHVSKMAAYGAIVGFVVGVVVTAAVVVHWARSWYRGYVDRGFALLAHVNDQRPVRGEDIRLAFDPDVSRERDDLLDAIMNGEGEG